MNREVCEEMSTALVTIGWEETMECAWIRMQTHRIRHLPVVDDRKRIVGILSDRDVQRAKVSCVDAPSRQPLPDERVEFDSRDRVRDYMSWPAKSVDRAVDLRLVAQRMVVEKISSFLVCSGTEAIGIVTSEDLLRVLIVLLQDASRPKPWTLADLLVETDSLDEAI